MVLLTILAFFATMLLIVLIILQFAVKKKSDVSEITELLKKHSREQNETVGNQLSAAANEQFQRFATINDSLQKTLWQTREEQARVLREFQAQVDARLSSFQQSNAESGEKLGNGVIKTLRDNSDEINRQIKELAERLDSRLLSIQRNNTENNEKITAALENKMKSLQESNEKRLEQMQGIVDEKLQKTLETRLAQSFELVSRQLESVGQGLGEMKALAADAKSLKNALTNVKERGTYGEVRLEKLLSDILATSQYETNAEIADGKRVEFVIKLPGSGSAPLLLPIDSKFPIEDYNRLLDADDKSEIENARKSLTQKIRSFAKDICDKYISPPKTTDFALMFLPTEGLYAEVVQNASLFEELRDKYKVTAVGATTLSAFLASLQMGFKTLAIEQRSQEVWDTLGDVKKAFADFEKLLETAHKQLQLADNTIEKIVGVRTRAINRALRNVEEFGEGKLLEGIDVGEERKVVI